MKTFFRTIITFMLSVSSNAQWVQKNSPVSEDEQISSININEILFGSNFAILNMMGQRVLSGKINSRSTLLEVGGLPGGSYLVRVRSREANAVLRFVKE